jgi:hypothetical protein
LALLFACFAVQSIRCAEAASSKAAPHAQFSETVFDFGKIKPGALQRHDFTVTNTGGATLVISAVEPGCGCTTAEAWDREIAPGKSGKIPIQFNPANFNGHVAKAISITCNDRARPNPVLEIQATVWRPLDVQPAFITFLPVENEPDRETKIARIVNNADAPVSLEVSPSTNPRFQLELTPVRDGREFELRVSYDSAVTAGDLNTAVTIKTSNPEQPTLSLTAFAMPQPAVAIVPGTIQLPAGRLDASYSFNLVIRNNSHTPLAVTAPATNLAGAVLRLTEAEPGKLFYLNLSCPEGFKPPAGETAAITFKTTHPKFQEVHVPVVQAAPATAAAK